MLKKSEESYPVAEKEIKPFKQPALKAETNDDRISVLEIIGTATRGGMENYLVNFFKNLPAGKFKITCICPCESLFTKTLREIGVEQVFIAPLADDPEWRSVQTAMEACKLHQVDVLHAHMPKSHVLAAIAGSLLNKPVVATLHGMHVTAHELGVALAAKSHLITNCQETYIQALTLGVPAERVNLFQNGVDISTFAPRRRDEEWRERFNLPKTATLVGFVGRLEFEKGPDLFIKAAAHVHQALPGVHFVMVGAGSMLKKLVQMREQLQLTDCLHFADWSTDTAAVYAALDLVAHSSRNDGTSLVLLEAMACAKPVVGMAVGGIREIIENEHGGMLVSPNDHEAMGNEIISLLEQPGLLQQMGAAARKRVETHFDVKKNTQQAADLLERVALSGAGETGKSTSYKLPLVVNTAGAASLSVS